MKRWVDDVAQRLGPASCRVTHWAFSRLDLQVMRLWTHADNAPSRAAAERAGFTRDPSGDRLREVKGEVWPTVAYELRRHTADPACSP